MTQTLWELDRYRIRRKFWKFLGASFHVFDVQDRVVGFCSQKAFRLKEDIRVYTGEDQATELLLIRARQIIDFAAAYDVVDPRGPRKIGALRRRGLRSMVRDSWEALDQHDKVLGSLCEDSMGKALCRRFLSNLVPQSFHLQAASGGPAAVMKQRFNPLVYHLEVSLPSGFVLDHRLAFATAVLIAAIEGRQR